MDYDEAVHGIPLTQRDFVFSGIFSTLNTETLCVARSPCGIRFD